MTALQYLCRQTQTHPEDWDEVPEPEREPDKGHWFRHASGHEAFVLGDEDNFILSQVGYDDFER